MSAMEDLLETSLWKSFAGSGELDVVGVDGAAAEEEGAEDGTKRGELIVLLGGRWSCEQERGASRFITKDGFGVCLHVLCTYVHMMKVGPSFNASYPPKSVYFVNGGHAYYTLLLRSYMHSYLKKKKPLLE